MVERNMAGPMAHGGLTIEVTSASGPRIVVQDYYNNQVLASTEDLLSTSGWRNCWLISRRDLKHG